LRGGGEGLAGHGQQQGLNAASDLRVVRVECLNIPLSTWVAHSKSTSHYIVLEDLTKGLDAACVCDLKIGRRGHDEQASTKKVLQQKALCAVTTSSSLGFRMCGMRVRTPTLPTLRPIHRYPSAHLRLHPRLPTLVGGGACRCGASLRGCRAYTCGAVRWW
jgi:hypothetical protein